MGARRGRGKSTGRKAHDRDRARQAAKADAQAQRGGMGLLTVPTEIKMFKPKADARDDFAVVPFVVQQQSPAFRQYEKGDLCYSLQYGQHRDVGPGDEKVICPKATFGKPCPLCDEFEDLREEQEYDDIKYLRPSMRDVFIVIKDGDEMFLDIPNWFFGKALAAEMDHAVSRDEPLFYFPEDNCDVRVTWVEGNFKGTVEASSVTFVTRGKRDALDEDMLAKWEGFDMLSLVEPKLLSYKDIEAIMNGDDPVDSQGEEGGEEEPATETAAQKKARLAKEKKEAEEADPGPEEDDAEADCQELYDKVKELGGRKDVKEARAMLKELDIKGLEDIVKDLEDDGDGEPADEPADGDNPCPSGHKWGIDCDKNPDDCDNCDKWNDCLEARPEG